MSDLDGRELVVSFLPDGEYEWYEITVNSPESIVSLRNSMYVSYLNLGDVVDVSTGRVRIPVGFQIGTQYFLPGTGGILVDEFVAETIRASGSDELDHELATSFEYHDMEWRADFKKDEHRNTGCDGRYGDSCGRPLDERLCLFISEGESSALEFKSSMRWDYQEEKVNKDLEGVILKSIAAFINHQGGTLLIGVSDEGEPLGLRLDIRKGSSPVYTTNSARGGPPVEKIYVRSGNSC